MTSSISPRARHARRSLLAFSACALLAAGATAQPAGADRSYREQVQACRSGTTYQTREACLAEARAARAARQSGRIETYGNHAANALARCNAYREQEDVLACRGRVMGLGQVTGSVASGGLLRQYEYLVPAPEAQAGAPSATDRDSPSRQQRAMGAGPSSARDPRPGSAAGASRLAPDHPAARMARPPQPVEPLEPILPTTPAFPMYEK